MTAPIKLPTEPQASMGGTTPVAQILLPQPGTALPIHLVASKTGENARRPAPSARRRIRPA
jgi:hypothetical protein